MQRSKIEWTDATWNPVRGCTRVSEGCRRCYAERIAARFSGPGMAYEGLAHSLHGQPRWTGEVRLVEERLADPLRWTKPRRIFVNSMSDLFHEKLSDEVIDRIFAVMALAPQHTFQILTKRPERMRDYLRRDARVYDAISCAVVQLDARGRHLRERAFAGCTYRADWPLPNVWLGVSVEHQGAANERIPVLLEAPAAVRFISAEPLLGPIDFVSVMAQVGRETGLHWVIAGGESGPGARPMHPAWPRSIRDQCRATGRAFFFKQWGEYEPVRTLYGPGSDDDRGDLVPVDPNGTIYPDGMQPPPGTHLMERVGKRAAGRWLDGRTWDEYPQTMGVHA